MNTRHPIVRCTAQWLTMHLLVLAAVAQDPVDPKKEAVRRSRRTEAALDRETIHGMLRGHVAAMFSTAPRRLTPGASGDATVVLALQPESVLRPGDHFVFTYERVQGPALLGDWRIDPAKPGLLETALRGQLVYDNTATLRLPIQIDAGATHGRHELEFVLECDVTDSRSGEARGRFAMDVVGYVEVGDALPTPRVAVAADGAPSRGETDGSETPGNNPSAEPSETNVDDPAATSRSEASDAAPVRAGADAVDDPDDHPDAAQRTADASNDEFEKPSGSNPDDPDRTGLWLAVGVTSIGLMLIWFVGRRRGP